MQHRISISHSGDISPGVVARLNQLIGVDLDVEFTNLENSGLANFVCNSHELVVAAKHMKMVI